jgi:hypothetical protein
VAGALGVRQVVEVRREDAVMEVFPLASLVSAVVLYLLVYLTASR